MVRQATRQRLLAVALLLFAACSKNAPSIDIGPSGGTIELAGKEPRVSLRVPTGAVARAVPFTLRSLPGRLPGAVGPAVEATPHGALFDKPVALRFSPKPEELPRGINFAELRVATLKGGRWELLPTSFPAPGVVEGATTHFSTFALVAPCHAAGLGDDFPLTDCPRFDPRIQTSAPLEVDAMAGAVTVKLRIGATAGGSSETVTVSGLTPNHNYFLHQDDQPALTQLLSDSVGALQFQVDTSSEHFLLLMANHGSITLTAATCPTIGTWAAATKTCTLTADYATPPIYIAEDGLTLDCLDATTGQPHVIGGARQSAGVSALKHADTTVRNCTIANVDVGFTGAGSNLRVDHVTVINPVPLDRGIVGFDFTGDSVGLANFDHISVENFNTGLFLETNGATIRNAAFKTRAAPIVLHGNNALLEDLALDGTLSGAGPLPPASPYLAAIAVSASSAVVVRRVSASGMGAFQAAIAAVFSSTNVSVEGVNITGARIAVQLDGPAAATVTGSTLTGNIGGIVSFGGTHLVFHNNIFGNSASQVLSSDPIELSDTRPASPTFGHGNFWGRTCPGPLFIPGTDSNAANVIDSHPFGTASAWTSGGTPGCAVSLAAPVLTAPAQGAALSSATPTFLGLAAAGATVELLEGAAIKGSAVAGPAGTFSLVATSPFADGPHAVTARARLGAVTSQASAPLSFVVDTVAPLAPVIAFPSNGASVGNGSVAVVGTAEAGAAVRIKDGTSFVATGTATAAGAFQVSLFLSPGAHVLAAVAADAAGNASAASTPVGVVVLSVSPTSPLVGVKGKLQVQTLTLGLDPFAPPLGETSDVQVAGALLVNASDCKNGQGNGNGNGNAKRQCQVELRREVVQTATGQVVSSMEVAAPLIAPVGPGKPGLIYTVENVWDGRLTNGTFAPEGLYTSRLTVWVIRDKPPGPPLPPGPLPPDCNSPNAANCKIDVFEFLDLVTLVHQRIPIPGGQPPGQGDCNTGALIVELCNGIDDNCNGSIDEGDACANRDTTCTCVPKSCAQQGITCGTAHDGCTTILNCGGPCL